jgi:hypothetical protein
MTFSVFRIAFNARGLIRSAVFGLLRDGDLTFVVAIASSDERSSQFSKLEDKQFT